MIAILKAGVPQAQIDNLIHWLESQGLKIHVSAGDYYTVLGLVGDTGKIDMDLLARRIIQELEGYEGHNHLEEYADASTARGKSLLKAICRKMGFDSLGYQSLDGLLEAIGIDKEKICTYCWNGKG